MSDGRDKRGGRIFRDAYVLSKSIGSGNFSIVRQCRDKFARCMYAAKIMEIKGTKQECDEIVDMVKNEVSIVRKLKHEYIIQFVDVFFEAERVIVITELSEYGDLHDFTSKNAENMDEMQARLFALHIASAVNYMHSLHIVHRDIKPENFLIFKGKQETNYLLKLCDFGLAEEVLKYGGLTRICGTPSFVAPEILEKKNYGLPVDIWSMGITFYFMLSQCCPFDHVDMNLAFELIIKSDLQFPSPRWDCISGDAKDLIRNMLTKNPKKRVVSGDVMHHKWFHQKSPSKNISSKEKKMTFKSASIAVISANILQGKQNCKLLRENAILSLQMLENVRSSYRTNGKQNISENTIPLPSK